MKANKFMLAGMLVAALAMVGCKDKNPADDNNGGNGQDTTVVEEPTLELPFIAAPEEGKVIVAIHIPAGTACNGIVFKGTNDNWSTVPEVPFVAVPEEENWYSVTLDLAQSAMLDNEVEYFYFGKACLLPEEGGVVDANWTTQWKDGQIEIINEDGNAPAVIGCGGETNKMGITGTGVIYVEVSAWQSVPCAADETYTVSLKAPVLPEGYDTVFVIGSVKESGWSTAIPMTLTDGAWVTTVTGQSTDEIKFRLTPTSWDVQLQSFEVSEENPEGEWKDASNLGLGKDLNIVLDYSDPAKYRWTPAASAE